jgi:predicted Zn-ribbon and HTH transcriptional regulator
MPCGHCSTAALDVMKGTDMKRKRKPRVASDCIIPERPPVEALRKSVLGASPFEEKEIVEYFEAESRKSKAKVQHLELVKTETVWGRTHKVWDIHATDGRWWVITEPTNLYSQALFPSLDYTLSFHIGLMARVMAKEARQASVKNAELFASAWRRWEQAAEANSSAKEAEDFQAVGMKCRECLLAFAREAQKSIIIPDKQEAPKRSDFIHWMELLADQVASGAHAKEIRKHLKDSANTTWQLANWLTHTSNANRANAEIVVVATKNLLEAYTMALVSFESKNPGRCPKCSSYQLESFYVPELEQDPPYMLVCMACHWEEPAKI